MINFESNSGVNSTSESEVSSSESTVEAVQADSVNVVDGSESISSVDSVASAAEPVALMSVTSEPVTYDLMNKPLDSFTFTEFVLACAFLFALGKFTWWLFWGAWYRKGE